MTTFRKFFASTCLLCLCAAAIPFAAHADSGIVSVQVGVGTATSSSARNDVSGSSIHVGASLNLGQKSTLFVLPGTQSIDGDYNYSSGHDGHISTTGITYDNRISLVPGAAQGLTAHVVPYIGFGVGGFLNSLSANEGSTHVKSAYYNFGGKLIAGVKIQGGGFFEVDYLISGETVGIRTDTVNFSLGKTF